MLNIEDLKVGDKIKYKGEWGIYKILENTQNSFKILDADTGVVYKYTNFDLTYYEKAFDDIDEEELNQQSINELKGVLKPQEKSLKQILQEIQNIVKSDVTIHLYNDQVVLKILSDFNIEIDFEKNIALLISWESDEEFCEKDLKDIHATIKLINENIDVFKFDGYDEE